MNALPGRMLMHVFGRAARALSPRTARVCRNTPHSIRGLAGSARPTGLRCEAGLPEVHRAVHIRTVGSGGGPEALELTTLPLPWEELGPSDVLIRVASAGVNRPDVLQRRGLYPHPPGHSPLPGLEVSGHVVALGPSVPLHRLALGDAVCALTNGGGYAEFCVAPHEQCLPIPVGLSTTEAACVPETFFTCWHNLMQQANIFGERLLDRPQPSVLIHGGSSGIGTTAIQLCRAFGVDVLATAGSKMKCRVCMDIGSRVALNYREIESWDEAVLEATAGQGVDVILDMVCGSYAQRNLRALKVGGRLAVIGSNGGYSATNLDLKSLMRKRLTIGGSTLRARETALKGTIASELLSSVWPLFDRRDLRVLLDSSFPLEKAPEAHRRMESGAHIGKIALLVDQPGSGML